MPNTKKAPGCQIKVSGSDELITLRPVESDQLPNEIFPDLGSFTGSPFSSIIRSGISAY